MPCAVRVTPGGFCYHVLNRGNDRRRVFFKDGDYQAFLKAMAHACVEVPMRVVGFCLMPNHFHMVLWPISDGDLSSWMHWLQNTHVRRYHKHYHGSGHIWQGRFKSFPIAEDEHLLTVLRYAERNPVRANLVKCAEHWQWSSARYWLELEEQPSYLVTGPVRRPKDWLEWVNQPVTDGEVEALRRSVNRGRPFGAEAWAAQTAERLGLEATLRPRGRPRKTDADTKLK